MRFCRKPDRGDPGPRPGAPPGPGGDPAALRALLSGVLELSGGVAAMAGLAPTPANLALASFLLGSGGLCVHLQAAAVAAPLLVNVLMRLIGGECF